MDGRGGATATSYLPSSGPAGHWGITRYQSPTLADTHHNSLQSRCHKSCHAIPSLIISPPIGSMAVDTCHCWPWLSGHA